MALATRQRCRGESKCIVFRDPRECGSASSRRDGFSIGKIPETERARNPMPSHRSSSFSGLKFPVGAAKVLFELPFPK